MGYSFSEDKDPFTDDIACNLVSIPVAGVVFGFDNHGAFIQSERPLQDESFAHFAVRVDGNKAFSGLEPAELKEREERLGALSRLAADKTISFERFEDLVKAVRDDPMLHAKRIYMVKSESNEFEQFLREMALGDRLLVRIVLRGGSDSLAEFYLANETSEGKMHNVFDLFAYQYADCLYGRQR